MNKLSKKFAQNLTDCKNNVNNEGDLKAWAGYFGRAQSQAHTNIESAINQLKQLNTSGMGDNIDAVIDVLEGAQDELGNAAYAQDVRARRLETDRPIRKLEAV